MDKEGRKEGDVLENTDSPSDTRVTTGDNSFLTLQFPSCLVLSSIGQSKVERLWVHGCLFTRPFGLSLLSDVGWEVAWSVLFWDG